MILWLGTLIATYALRPDAPWCERGGVADLEVDAVDGAGTNRGWFLTLSHS